MPLTIGRTRIILWGGVRADNPRAIRYYEKNGFQPVGLFTEADGSRSLDLTQSPVAAPADLPRPYTSNDERTAALADVLRTHNHHRCHTALGGQPPISRVNNPAGQYTWLARALVLVSCCRAETVESNSRA